MTAQQPQHHYEGAGFFRQRLLLASLTGTPIRISRMHISPSAFADVAGPADSGVSGQVSSQPQYIRGVQPYEASLLRLLCSITEGSRVHINAAGTTLTYHPGQLVGCDPDKLLGAPLLHHCHPSKPVSYYLEPLLLLAPFCKHALHIRLTGVTDSEAPPRSKRKRVEGAKQRSNNRSSRRTKKESYDTVNTSGEAEENPSESVSHVSNSSPTATSKRSDNAEWNFTCSDPPIDFVRSVTIPTLQRLLRLATTTSLKDVNSVEKNISSKHQHSISQRQDESVSVSRTSELPDPFYVLRVVRRCCGSRSAGGMRNGEVLLKTCGTLQVPLQPFVWTDVGRVKRIRGTAFTVGGLSPLFAKRCISRARYIFNMLLPDVWIYLEKQQPNQKAAARNATAKGALNTKETSSANLGKEEEELQQQRGLGAGVGLALVAETIKMNYKGAAGIWSMATPSTSAKPPEDSSNLFATSAADAWTASGSCKLEMLLKQQSCRESTSVRTADGEEETAVRGAKAVTEGGEETEAEKLAEAVVRRLLLEVQQGGVVDTAHQYMPLLFAALAEEHAVSRIRLPRLTPYAVQFIRHLRDFLGVVFHVEDEVTAAKSFESFPRQHSQERGGLCSSLGHSRGITLKCVGIGLKNMARATF